MDARTTLLRAIRALPGVMSLHAWPTRYPYTDVAILPFEDFRSEVALDGILTEVRALVRTYSLSDGDVVGVSRAQGPFLIFWERNNVK